MLSYWEDPFNQESLLQLLRQGNTLTECLRIMEGSPGGLRKQRAADRNFDEAVMLAQASAFTPVMRRLVEQATHGDTDDPATLKAWELVTRHYNKALDREHRHAIVDHQHDRQLEQGTGTPGLGAPNESLIIDLIDAIKEVAHDNEEQAAIESGSRNEDEV